MSAPIAFYFDVVSPYAYVAWLRLPALAARHGRELAPIPILFAALLDAHGQRGPAEIPAKRAYVYKDAYRKAHRAGAILRLPPSHPFNPLLALRVASVAEASEPAAKERLRAQTTAAIARGVFGVPTIDADGELFWGTDGLDHLDAFLAGEDPVPADLAIPPASATRPGSI